MSDQMSLDSILDDKPQEEKPDAPAVDKPEGGTPVSSTRQAHQQKERDAREAAEGRVRDPATGKYVKADEKKEEKEEKKEEVKAEVKPEPKAEVKEEMTAKEKAFLKAAEEERRKRQDLERELASLRKPAEVKADDKTFWDDPEGALAKIRQESQRELTKIRLDTSEAIARRHYQDFDEKVTVFMELTKANPALYQQMVASPDPAEFAYRVGKSQKDVQEAGNIEQLREKIEKETRAKVEAELREKLKKEAEDRAKAAAELPGSLSNVTGSNPTSRPSWGGPTPLDSILKG